MRWVIALLFFLPVAWASAGGCAPVVQSCDGCATLTDPDTGACVICLVDADCGRAGASSCINGSVCMSDHTCGCITDADCTSNAYGPVCKGGQCGCNVDADCTARTWGAKCDGVCG